MTELAPQLKALWEEYKAVHDGRIHKGYYGEEVFVSRYENRWIIEVRGVECQQRDILFESLVNRGLPDYAAEWIAAKCPNELLPDREQSEAMLALQRWADDDGVDNSMYFTSGGVSTRTAQRCSYVAWSNPVIYSPPLSFSSTPTIPPQQITESVTQWLIRNLRRLLGLST